jgi:hypothetical protein
LLVRARLYDPICSMIAIATTSLFGVCFAAYPGSRPGHGRLFFEAAPQIQSRQGSLLSHSPSASRSNTLVSYGP